MDKRYSSRKQHRRAHFLSSLVALGCVVALPQALRAISLTHSEALAIGKKIWQNECNGTIAGLTSWNEGENFASLGIGHFIWYPKGQRGPFEESFPKLVSFIAKRGAKLPGLLLGIGERPCPWNSRAEFLQAQNTPEMKQLRQFLADTVDLQAEFLISRLQKAPPKMLGEAAPSDRPNVQQQFERLASTPQGSKGAAAVDEFARSAKAILTRRVQNAPAERRESRWLSGWLQRVNSYTRG